MEQQEAMQEIARVDAIVRTDGGGAAFTALAEAHRRAGRVNEAERIARDGLRTHPDHPAGRVVLGLALLDQDRIDEARAELARVLDAVPDHPLAAAALDSPALPEVEAASEPDFLAVVGDAELENAFESAEAQRDEMIDADGVAAAALRRVEQEGDGNDDSDADDPFRTHTMAGLLESQGHRGEAQQIRDQIRTDGEARFQSAQMDRTAPPSAASPVADDGSARAAVATSAPLATQGPGPAGNRRERVVDTLETWLDNLRKARR